MNPTDLNDDEMLALVLLSRAMVAADGKLGVEEMQEMNEIGVDLGVEAFTRISKMADEEDASRSRALEIAARVERPRARELLLTMLGDLASADGVEDDEQKLLDDLREIWS